MEARVTMAVYKGESKVILVQSRRWLSGRGASLWRSVGRSQSHFRPIDRFPGISDYSADIGKRFSIDMDALGGGKGRQYM